MLILFDTNIILDILEKRQPFYEASKSVLEKCISNDIRGCIALHSVSNIYYILRKRFSVSDRRKLLLDLLDLLQVAGTDHEHVKNALQRESFSDFEDCLQDECAKTNFSQYRSSSISSSNCIPLKKRSRLLILYSGSLSIICLANSRSLKTTPPKIKIRMLKMIWYLSNAFIFHINAPSLITAI